MLDCIALKNSIFLKYEKIDEIYTSSIQVTSMADNIKTFSPDERAFNALLEAKKSSISTIIHLLKERLKLLECKPHDPFDIFKGNDAVASLMGQIAAKESLLSFYEKTRFDIQTVKTLKYYDNEALFELYWDNPCDRFLQSYDKTYDYFPTFKAKYEHCINKRMLLENDVSHGISHDMRQAGLYHVPCILALSHLPIEMRTSVSERLTKTFD